MHKLTHYAHRVCNIRSCDSKVYKFTYQPLILSDIEESFTMLVEVKFAVNGGYEQACNPPS